MMKYIYHFGLALSFFLVTILVSYSQTGINNFDSLAVGRANVYKNELKLKDEQFNNWKKLEKHHLQSIDSLQKFGKNIAPMQLQEWTLKVQKFYENEVTFILNSKQLKVYLSKQKERQAIVEKRLKDNRIPVKKL